MTRSARGTAAEPGSRVRQKAGLNRVVRDTGWAELRMMLEYKVGRLVAVDPRNTSRTCHACGHADAASRRTQASFTCTACGRAAHADLNAAANIQPAPDLFRGRRGLALLHGEGRSGLRTPEIRENAGKRAA